MAETAENPQTASQAPKEKQERVRSAIDFPYNSLDDAVTLVKAIHKLGGNECRLELLAAELGHETATSGGFQQKVTAARRFGLVTGSQRIVTLTTLGAKIVDSDQEKAARAEAFLTVPLYKAIYEEFKNGALPPPSGLEAKMVALGVPEKQKDRARQVFQRSAKEAGFFAYGATKLVYPALGNVGSTTKSKDFDQKQDDGEKGGGGGNGGDGGDKKRHPLIEGLLETLPFAALGAEKKEWGTQERMEWLQTASGIFNLVYKTVSEDKGVTVSVSITRPKDSAN